MKVWLFIPFFIAAGITIGFSQKNFTKAKVITNGSDTLSGYIDYKEWIKSPGQISFKANEEQTAITYAPYQIAGFIIDDNKEAYHSLEFAVENLPRSSNKVLYFNLKEYTNRVKKIESVSAFVRVISDGKATLYHYVNKDSEPHFLIKKDGALTVLVYHVVETKNYSARYREYRSQLSGLLNDTCEKLAIYNVDYYVGPMRKLIDSYNACFNGAKKTDLPHKDRGRWEYGVMAGAGYTSMTHSMATPYRNFKVDGEAHITPVVGAFLNYVFARGRGRFALLNELHTYQFKSMAFFDDEYYRYNMHYLGMQHLFRYTFYVGKPSVYGLIGFSYAAIMKQKSTLERRDGSVEALVMMPWSVRNDEQRAIAGLGLSRKRLMLEARYYRGNGFSYGISSATPNNRIDLLMKWNFGKLPN